MYQGSRMAQATRGKEEKGHDQLDDVGGQHACFVRQRRQLMPVSAQHMGQRLGLVVIVHAGQVPPAGVPAQLNQARPKKDAKK